MFKATVISWCTFFHSQLLLFLLAYTKIILANFPSNKVKLFFNLLNYGYQILM